MASHRYLDILENKLVIKTPNGFKSQIFWFDGWSRTIKSESNSELSLDIANGGMSKKMQLWTTNSAWFQLFILEGDNIINIKNHRALEVVDSKDEEGQLVGINTRTTAIN